MDTKRVQTDINDGDLCDFGFGNIDYETMCQDKTLLPVEMCYNNGPCKLPDKLAMASDKTGNKCFFCWDRTAGGIRHTRHTNGLTMANDPSEAQDWKKAQALPQIQNTMTAGMVSSTMDVFNKNYWLNKAAGPNNGILWGNKLYVTFVDNIRGHIMMITKRTETSGGSDGKYDPSKTTGLLRHVKEFKVTVLVRLCKVKLEAKLITWLLQFNSGWLNDIGFKFHTPGPNVTNQGFRDVFHVPTVEEGEEEEERMINCIKVDCTGQVSLQHSERSLHPLAVTYHSQKEAAGPPPKKAATKRGRT